MKLKGFIRKAMGKVAGVNKLQEQVDGLFYILNACVDIRNFPPATGAIRDLQICDITLLKIFDKACKKHNLTYWLEAGTLLGAVRHRGFIPWDDDLDVCMPRDSFDKAKDALCEELRSYGLQAEEDMPMGRIGIGYKHKQTGVWLDVFPADYCALDLHNQKNRATITTHIQKYNKYYWKNKTKKAQSVFQNKKQRIFPEFAGTEHAESILFAPEAVGFVVGLNCDEMYPLQNITFEGYDFPAPANAHAYLVQWYGENYMQFPKDGYFHHGDASGQLIHWAKNSNTDMSQIQRELEEILRNI